MDDHAPFGAQQQSIDISRHNQRIATCLEKIICLCDFAKHPKVHEIRGFQAAVGGRQPKAGILLGSILSEFEIALGLEIKADRPDDVKDFEERITKVQATVAWRGRPVIWRGQGGCAPASRLQVESYRVPAPGRTLNDARCLLAEIGKFEQTDRAYLVMGDEDFKPYLRAFCTSKLNTTREPLADACGEEEMNQYSHDILIQMFQTAQTVPKIVGSPIPPDTRYAPAQRPPPPILHLHTTPPPPTLSPSRPLSPQAGTDSQSTLEGSDSSQDCDEKRETIAQSHRSNTTVLASKPSRFWRKFCELFQWRSTLGK